MPLNLYLSNTTSDLSLGIKMNNNLELSPTSAGTYSFTVANGETNQMNYAYSKNNDLDFVAWTNGNITVKMIVTTSANMLMSVSLSRISESGTVLQTTTATATQSLSTTGVKTFTINATWGTPNSTDRLRVNYIVSNNTMGGNTTIVETGTTNTEIVTPFIAMPKLISGSTNVISDSELSAVPTLVLNSSGELTGTSSISVVREISSSVAIEGTSEITVDKIEIDIKSGFVIERKVNEGQFEYLDSVLSNISQYIDSTISRGNTYTYRIKSIQGEDISDYSNEYSYTYPNMSYIDAQVNLTGGNDLNVISQVKPVRNATVAMSQGSQQTFSAKKTAKTVPLNSSGVNQNEVAKKGSKSALVITNGINHNLVVSPIVRRTSFSITHGYNHNVAIKKLGRSPPIPYSLGDKQTLSTRKLVSKSLLISSGSHQVTNAKKHIKTTTQNSLATNVGIEIESYVQTEVNTTNGTRQNVVAKKAIKNSITTTNGSNASAQRLKGAHSLTSNTIGFKQSINSVKKIRVPLANSLTTFNEVGVNRKSLVSNVNNSIGSKSLASNSKNAKTLLTNSVGPKQLVGAFATITSQIDNSVGSTQSIIAKKHISVPPSINSIGVKQSSITLTHRRKLVTIQNGLSNSLVAKKNFNISPRLSNGETLFLNDLPNKIGSITLTEGSKQDVKHTKLVRQSHVIENGVIQYTKGVKGNNISILVDSLGISLELDYLVTKLLALIVESVGEVQTTESIKSILEDVTFTEGFNQDITYVFYEEDGLTCIDKPTGIKILSSNKTLLIILSPLGNDIAIISPLKTNVKEVDCND